MKQITLTKGFKTIVDNNLFDFLNTFSWSITSNGYAQTKVNGIKNPVLMHQLIFNLSKGYQADHINLNKLDNRTKNLRACLPKDNSRNRGINKNNKSGFKGVFLNKQRGCIEVYITVDKKHKYIGRFKTLKEAAKAYNTVAIKYFGDFAWLNKL